MKQVTLSVSEYVFSFYDRVGKQAGGLSAEKVMEDTLFKLAGELSLNALHKSKNK